MLAHLSEEERSILAEPEVKEALDRFAADQNPRNRNLLLQAIQSAGLQNPRRARGLIDRLARTEKYGNMAPGR